MLRQRSHYTRKNWKTRPFFYSQDFPNASRKRYLNAIFKPDEIENAGIAFSCERQLTQFINLWMLEVEAQ